MALAEWDHKGDELPGKQLSTRATETPSRFLALCQAVLSMNLCAFR